MAITRADCAALDQADPLAPFRDSFTLPEGRIYLDGNSLGALPRATPSRVVAVVEAEWGRGLIAAWNDAGWIGLPERVGDKIGRLLGAPPGTVISADSTSVNLFKVLAAALRLRPDRRVVLSELGNFPTDLYVAEGLLTLLGGTHTLRTVAAGALAAALDQDVAAVLLTHVDYRTGAMHDLAAVTAAAHAAGALTVWDLAHSAGAVPIDLTAAAADFAVGCGYKFLNGGPGAPAFLYAAPALHPAMRFPITGWLGHADPFGFHPGYAPAGGIAQAAIGTPSILAMAALEVGVDIALAAPMGEIRAKSLQQSALLMELAAQECPALACATPRSDRRGSQVAFHHASAYALMQALIAEGVTGDYRPPGLIRFGITPLYLRYVDLWDAVAILRRILDTGAWQAVRFQGRQRVT